MTISVNNSIVNSNSPISDGALGSVNSVQMLFALVQMELSKEHKDNAKAMIESVKGNQAISKQYAEVIAKLNGLDKDVLAKFNNENDITIRDFISRRSTLLNKKCGGVRMHCLPLRTIIEPTATVLESMEIINKAQQDVFLHADYSTMKYYYEERMRYQYGAAGTYSSISFTYQPATRKSLIPYLKDIPFKSRWYCSGRQPQPFYITAMHRPGDGGLNFYFGYQKDSATPEEI